MLNQVRTSELRKAGRRPGHRKCSEQSAAGSTSASKEHVNKLLQLAMLLFSGIKNKTN